MEKKIRNHNMEKEHSWTTKNENLSMTKTVILQKIEKTQEKLYKQREKNKNNNLKH